MNVLITGGSGVIGTALQEVFTQNSIDYLCLSRSKSHFPYEQTDYSIESLRRIFLNNHIDIVVHLAAKRGRNTAEGYQAYRENELLTENILKVMLTSNVKRIIYLSSISVYSDSATLPWVETSIATPGSFYGLSKLASEYLCHLYSFQGIEPTILRCAHLLSSEKSGYMLNKFMEAAKYGETLNVFGQSYAKREFVYVKDVAECILFVILNNITGIYNLGSEESLTNLEVAELINQAFGNKSKIYVNTSVSENINSSYMNSNKLVKIGFSPRYSFFQGVLDIIGHEK